MEHLKVSSKSKHLFNLQRTNTSKVLVTCLILDCQWFYGDLLEESGTGLTSNFAFYWSLKVHFGGTFNAMQWEWVESCTICLKSNNQNFY